MDDGRVLACHVSRQEAVFYSEVGSARAILEAGYTLESFLVRCTMPCDVIFNTRAPSKHHKRGPPRQGGLSRGDPQPPDRCRKKGVDCAA